MTHGLTGNLVLHVLLFFAPASNACEERLLGQGASNLYVVSVMGWGPLSLRGAPHSPQFVMTEGERKAKRGIKLLPRHEHGGMRVERSVFRGAGGETNWRH